MQRYIKALKPKVEKQASQGYKKIFLAAEYGPMCGRLGIRHCKETYKLYRSYCRGIHGIEPTKTLPPKARVEDRQIKLF